MKLLEATEQGEVPVALEELTRNGRLWVRTEAMPFLSFNAPVDRGSAQNGMVAFRERLYVRGCVGVLPLNDDYAVLVRPKAPASITAMLRTVGRTDDIVQATSHWRSYAHTEESSDEMLDWLVRQFLDAAQAVADEGLYRTYARRREVSAHPRGRLVAGSTIQLAARGRSYLAESEYFERTLDNAPNQCMVAALRWCSRWVAMYVPNVAADGTEKPLNKMAWHRRAEESHKRIARLLHPWRGVEPGPGRWFLADPQVLGSVPMPGNRQAYVRALPLAKALLLRRGFSLDAAHGDLAFQSLLINTEALFETFVRTELASMLATAGLIVRNGNALREVIHLYEDAEREAVPLSIEALEVAVRAKTPTMAIEPDILIEGRDGRTRLVLDAKYKVVRGAAAETGDVRQLVTYAVNRRVRRVVSIHPMEHEDPDNPKARLYVAGRIGDITVYQYRVKLDAADLAAETALMAEVIAELAA